MTASQGEVVDDTLHQRFVLRREDHEAELVYHRSGGRLALLHTEVPDGLSGHGIGGQLVRAAIDLARRENLTLVPYCPFAAQWLRDHPEAGLTIDWPASDHADRDVPRQSGTS